MAGQTFVNPYTPLTPIGAGIQNITTALFSGNSPADDRKARLDAAHVELYGAQTAKARAEVEKMAEEQRLARELMKQRSPEAQAEMAAIRHGVPLPHVNAYLNGYLKGETPMPPALPGGVEIGDLNNTLYTLRTGMAGDKTISANDIALGTLHNNQDRMRSDVAAGRRSAGDVTDAFFSVSGKPRYDNMGGTGTFDQTTGATTFNPLGNAKVGTEVATANEKKAHAGYWGAAAGNQSAQAGEHSERRGKLADERAAGVNYGPPVIVQSPGNEAGRMVSPLFAAREQLAPQAKPSSAAGKTDLSYTGNDENGNPQFSVVPRTPGATITKPPKQFAPQKPMALTKAQIDDLNNELAGKAGAKKFENMDPQDAAAILSRAKIIAADPTSDWFRNPSGALEAAIAELAPGGFEDKAGWIATQRMGAKGGLRKQAPQAPGAIAPEPRSKQEYDALPMGTKYMGSDGKVRQKGGT